MKELPKVPQITEAQAARYNEYLVGKAIQRATNLAYARCSMVVSLLLMGYKIPYNDERGDIALYVGFAIFVLGGISVLVNRGETTSEI